jgi:hypothetical protein
MAEIIIHRNFEGEHETDSESCWCRPVVMESDDLRDSEDIALELEKEDG